MSVFGNRKNTVGNVGCGVRRIKTKTEKNKIKVFLFLKKLKINCEGFWIVYGQLFVPVEIDARNDELRVG